MKDHLSKLVSFGFLTWLVPFVVSFVFFDPQSRQLRVDEIYFKSIMVVVGVLTGVVLMVLYFKKVWDQWLLHGILVGSVWFLINFSLDVLMVWRGFFDMTYTEYFREIGMRYLVIPMYAIGLGYMLYWQEKRTRIAEEPEDMHLEEKEDEPMRKKAKE